jgi:glycosyltransferase involved in cell wall biosynthesis
MIRLARGALAFSLLPLLWVTALVPRRRSRVLVWGPVPIINLKYWSQAMREAGWDSETVVSEFYGRINARADFDHYFEDYVPAPLRGTPVAAGLGVVLAFVGILRRAAVLHIPFSGGPLGATPIWRYEAVLLRRAGVKTVVLPYGADVFQYSRIADPVVRNAMLLSYPEGGRRERAIAARVAYWSEQADVILMGFTHDGVGRWDIPVGNMVAIDTHEWTPPAERGSGDGHTEPVRVLHAPNHRGAKGTDAIVAAVDALRAEGLNVELELLEGVPNDEIRDAMRRADILADQLLLPGYGMASVEGMATGLPVICNLEDPAQTRLFRLFSFLDECPIVSAGPETVVERLRELVTEPERRRELGDAGRAYVECRHSYAAAQRLFGAIYRKLLDGEEVDLMTLFHRGHRA